MNVGRLHRLVTADIDPMIDAVNCVLPARMPKCYDKRSLNLVPFIKRLNAVTEPFGVFSEICRDVSLPIGQVEVSGIWIPAIELPENGSKADVRVIWHCQVKTRRLPLSPMRWDRRRAYFWTRVSHELVHRHQDRMRDPDVGDARNYLVRTENRAEREEQQYLGNYDELEAHAYDAAVELATWCPGATFSESVRVIAGVTGTAILPTYGMVLSAFPVKHPAILPFKRKVRAWWDQIVTFPEFYARWALPKLI